MLLYKLPAILLLLSLCACDKKPRAPVEPETVDRREEDDASWGDLGTTKYRASARAAAAALVRERVPSARIYGLSAVKMDGLNYVVSVDFSGDAGRRAIAELHARAFYPENGDAPYWRAAPLTSPALRRSA